mmetsp:Transcript_31219/g.65126  ORF Transcript_31219/g.65126 Transcript_31219/m.65126 type:complete len:591 (-) Transcript_31219:1633-3405(-)
MVYFCHRCQESNLKSLDEQASSATSSSEPVCHICLGIQQSNFPIQLQAAIETAIQPYHDKNNKGRLLRFSRQDPSIVLPGDVIVRFQKAGGTAKPQHPDGEAEAEESSSSSSSIHEEYARSIKHHSKQVLLQCLEKIEKDASLDREPLEAYPECVAQDELGYLGVHVIVLPQSHVTRPECVKNRNSNKNRQRRNKRKLDAPQQGGDPRVNHEARVLQHQEEALYTINQAVNQTTRYKPTTDLAFFDSDHFDDSGSNDSTTNPAVDIHVAIWRRPFYVGSCYSKTRRDVSQTPFFVSENGKRQRLGVTSVEEQILPAVERYCNGISTLNNCGGDDEPQSLLVRFGMAKFHASGREDMDVRMIVPSMKESDPSSLSANQTPSDKNGKKPSNITGRPFVCEIVDALSMPLPSELKLMVADINHESTIEKSGDSCRPTPKDVEGISYGQNPMGVGIAPTLEFVAPAAFKNLQAQTESKVKHYGCLCWSENELPNSNHALNALLGTFPLEIQQQTPLRVLHRRSNIARPRRVLSCHGTLVDNHYFRLHLSTEAGTYVKEFVHGDLGRTIPSVAKLFGCKTDILELDCEGIQLDDD